MMNRGRIEIMADMLSFCVQARLKTQIMYNANITFRQFETYETLLLSKGLLSREGGRYIITEKGHRFVSAFDRLQSTLEGVSSKIAVDGSFVTVRHGTPVARVLSAKQPALLQGQG